MANIDSLQTHPIESPRQMLVKDFEKLKGKLSGSSLEYKDSKWEKILITRRGDKIGIYKAKNPNESMSVFPNFQNIKSSYELIRRNDKFSLETKTYTWEKQSPLFLHAESENILSDLDLVQVNNSIKVFITRIDEAKVFEQNEKNKNYKKMQQYAYNQEVQDKNDADNLINGLDDSWLA